MNTFYPKLGGNLTSGCQRLAEGLGAHGVVVILYRDRSDLAEVGMTFAPNLKVNAEMFRKLGDAVLDNKFSESLAVSNRACEMLADATGAQTVILFVINQSGDLRISVNKPQPVEIVAGCVLETANALERRN